MDKYIYDDKMVCGMNCKEIIISHVLSYQPNKEQPYWFCGDSGTAVSEKEYRRATYITLFTSGRLNNYLADIDRQAQMAMERLTEQMKRGAGFYMDS